jgi:putative FmdB family regulatory protein
MPIYTYKCQSCNHEFYKNEALFEKPLKQCPKCINGVVRRVPPLPVVVFKGPGWYSTDPESASDHTNIPWVEPAPALQGSD